MQDKNKAQDKDGATNQNLILEINDLVVNYGGIKAVKGISLNVRHGELVSLIGANGAGKTTIMKAVTAIQKTDAGSIAYMGESIKDVPGWQCP